MIKITDINIKTQYSWSNIKDLCNWNTVKNTNGKWIQLKQISIEGRNIFAEVEAIGDSWLDLMSINNTWQDIYTDYLNWDEIKNF